MAANKYPKSKSEIIPTIRFSIGHLNFFAEADIQCRKDEKSDHDCNEDQVIHNLIHHATGRLGVLIKRRA